MENLRLFILLENLNVECKYHLEDGGETFCQRAWADTERLVLRYAQCGGHILKCELNDRSFLRCVAVMNDIIKQQPKINEAYINEKARQLQEASWTGVVKKERWVIGIKEARSFIGFIVSEVLGGKDGNTKKRIKKEM